MKYMTELRKRLCKELDELYEKGGQYKMADVDAIQKLLASIKDIDKIEMLEGEEMSHRGMSYRDGEMSMRRSRSYDDGDSYARRGQHYVRGHYSYDDGMDMSNARGGRRYSRNDAKDHMLNKMGEMMHNADPKEREILKKAMREIEDID